MNDLEKIYQTFLQHRSVKIDSREIKPNDIFFAISGENFNANQFAQEALKKGADLVVLDDKDFYDSGNEKMILVEDSLKTLQDLAKKYRADLEIPILGITGSNGKTTTKELVREVLSCKFKVLSTTGNLNNHIGLPLSILSIKPQHQIAVIEMGASHVGEIAELCEIARPTLGVITNISQAHIGEFGSYDNIVQTKMALYEFLDKNNGHKFDYCQPVEVTADNLLLEVFLFGEPIRTNLTGDYNAQNIGIAVEIGQYFDIDEDPIKLAIAGYVPDNNRSQFLETDQGNKVFLDAYNANPVSLRSSLESFFNKDLQNKVVIIGDMKELGEHSKKEHQEILDFVKGNKAEKVCVVGPEFFIFRDDYDFDFFTDTKSLIEFLQKESLQNKSVFIKASRGIGLEEIVERKLV